MLRNGLNVHIHEKKITILRKMAPRGYFVNVCRARARFLSKKLAYKWLWGRRSDTGSPAGRGTKSKSYSSCRKRNL